MTQQYTLTSAQASTTTAAVTIDGTQVETTVPTFIVQFTGADGSPLTVTFARSVDANLFNQLFPNGTPMAATTPDPPQP